MKYGATENGVLFPLSARTLGCPATFAHGIRQSAAFRGPARVPVDFFRVGRKVRTGPGHRRRGPAISSEIRCRPRLRCFAAGGFLGRMAYSFFDADVRRRCVARRPERTHCHRCVALARIPRSRRAVSGRRFVTRACAPWQGAWLPRKRALRSCAKARRFLEWPCDAS